MSQFANYIDGQWVEGASASRNVNPSNLDDIIGEFAQADADQTQRAISAARRAFAQWSMSTPQQRFDLLDQVGSSILARKAELGRLLAECPEIAVLEGESLADLELKDPSLDRLRRELLNLAASGSSLEKAGVQTHFTRKGMADLLARFAGLAVEDEDPRTLFQRAVADLRSQRGPRKVLMQIPKL